MKVVGVQFGLSQIGAIAPIAISRAKKATNYAGAGLLVFMPRITEMTGITWQDLSFWSGVIVLGVNTLGILTGVDPNSDEAIRNVAKAANIVNKGDTQVETVITKL